MRRTPVPGRSGAKRAGAGGGCAHTVVASKQRGGLREDLKLDVRGMYADFTRDLRGDLREIAQSRYRKIALEDRARLTLLIPSKVVRFPCAAAWKIPQNSKHGTSFLLISGVGQRGAMARSVQPDLISIYLPIH